MELASQSGLSCTKVSLTYLHILLLRTTDKQVLSKMVLIFICNIQMPTSIINNDLLLNLNIFFVIITCSIQTVQIIPDRQKQAVVFSTEMEPHSTATLILPWKWMGEHCNLHCRPLLPFPLYVVSMANYKGTIWFSDSSDDSSNDDGHAYCNKQRHIHAYSNKQRYIHAYCNKHYVTDYFIYACLIHIIKLVLCGKVIHALHIHIRAHCK
jgi:hypothetical protein